MAELIQMPRLSDTMEEGTIEKWHKNVGDSIAEGDIIAEIQTDKAVQEFESEYEGILLYQGIPEGSSIPVDSVLAVIGQAGEDFQALLNGGDATTSDSNEETVQTNVEVASTSESAPVALPSGVEIIQMPRLSDTMESGTVSKWHKSVGDQVSEGDLLTEIETDKAVQEFESEFEGTLLYAGVEEGGSSEVDTILAIIGPAGTDVTAIVANKGKVATAPKVAQQVEAVSSTTTSNQSETNLTNTTSGRIFVSPLAKKIASDKGIDLSAVNGSGENGRIIKKDIESFVPTAKTATVSSPTTSTSVTPFIPAGETTETTVSQMRKIIAKRLSESKFTAPHYYLNIEIDMENAMASRKVINALPDTKVSFNDLVIKASAAALRKHPAVNTTWADDKIITHGSINIGVAVAVPDGLVVPVVNNADYLQLTAISASVKDLATKARDRKLSAQEMSGSTFTISNLGMFGIESFTSIINAPNSCILSVGAIIEKPVVKDGQIVVGHVMKVTLAADHRTVDGAIGSSFLQTLKTYIENPVTILA